jgi:hypothetical protein
MLAMLLGPNSKLARAATPKAAVVPMVEALLALPASAAPPQ